MEGVFQRYKDRVRHRQKKTSLVQLKKVQKMREIYKKDKQINIT